MNLAVNRCCRSRPQCANKKRKGPDENADADKNVCIDGHQGNWEGTYDRELLISLGTIRDGGNNAKG
jgi:hypothetical protein